MPVSRGATLALSLSIFASGVAVSVMAQDASVETANSPPRNLQVLPKDLAPRSLGQLMKRYERDLGVSCSYCHVENRDTGKLDYVSDENPKKQIARIMIAMLDDINDRHLAQLGADARYAAGVTCGSCHQGRANPQAFEGRAR